MTAAAMQAAMKTAPRPSLWWAIRMVPVTSAPKYRQVFDTLVGEIQAGRLKTGDRLPSEAALVRRFGSSRITIARAMRVAYAAAGIEASTRVAEIDRFGTRVELFDDERDLAAAR